MNQLLFDSAANQYDVLGDTLSKDSLACLSELRRTLKKYDISLSGLYLVDKEIRAEQAGKTYLLGHIYTQGTAGARIIYPCFRDEFVFDFVQDIRCFSLWQMIDEGLKASYPTLKANLMAAAGNDEHRINFALTQEFSRMVSLGGKNFRESKQELDFLKGLLALYQVGLAQARMRMFHGVTLENPLLSGTRRRRQRAVERPLNLLVGDDVADIKLYRVIAAQSAASRPNIQLLSEYYLRWKGRVHSRQDFYNFLSAINLGSMPPDLFSGLHQLNALRGRSLAQNLRSLPAEGSTEWSGLLLSIHGEFTLVRQRVLNGILRPGGRHYLALGADYTINNKELMISYGALAVQGITFDGVINIVGHGIDIEGNALAHAEKVADWLYSNVLGTYAVAGFKNLKVVNFQACHISQVLATHITVLFLKKALPHFERNKIPNVLIVCSPRASLVLTADLPLGRLWSAWQEHYLVFPGIVLKAFRHLIDTYPTIRLALAEHFEWSGQLPDLNNLSFVDYLRRTHVLEVRRVSASDRDVSHVEEATLDFIQEPARAAVNTRRRAFNECARIINEKFPGMVGEIRSLVAIASIADTSVRTSQLLPVGEAETARKVLDFLVSLKTATERRDFVGGYNTYTRAKIKFLIDPYDPVGPAKIRHITDIVFRLCGHPVPASEYNYQLAYTKMFLLDKQDYWQMTGINIDTAAREFFKNIPYVEFTPDIFRFFQVATPQSSTIVVDVSLRQSLLGSEQIGVSTRELRTLLEGAEQAKILSAMDQLENNLKKRKVLLKDSLSLKHLQETEESLGRAKSSIQKKKLSPAVLKTTARIAVGSSRLLGAFGVFADFRTQPFQLDFSSVKSALFTTSDSLAVVKGIFDFTSDIGPVLALRLASSASRALWRPRLDQLFFKMNKVLLPLDVLFTAVSLYRNVEGAQLAKTAEEQALYITMTVIDAASFGVSLAGFILMGVPGVGIVLVLVGVALAIVNIILNSIVSLSQLENYRWDEKVALFFSNMFGSSALPGVLTQQQMRQAADQLFDGNRDHTKGALTTGLHEDGIDLFLTPMINDADDRDQTNPFKDIGTVSQGSSFRQEPRGYTLSPLGLGPDDLKSWSDAKHKDKAEQVYKGWYLRRRETRRGQERKLMVTMPSTPNRRREVLDFGPIPTILLFGATPHLLLEVNPFGWAAGESPQEQARNQYQVKLHSEIRYTLQFSKSVMASKNLDSNFGGRTALIVPEGEFQTLPQVSLDLSGQGDARETIALLDLSRSSLEVVKFKGKSSFRLDLVSAGSQQACALEQVVRSVQLPAHIEFKSGETHPVMAVVGDGSRITLRNSSGRSLLLLRREVSRCEINLHASVSGFAVSV
ncbi:hypothetical protein [Pseudomonas sp. FEN]|uniref:hypothetical protein n=1 Tax=Pseudomonas sp. FEN TaxID=2767468 RepID=UPI001CD1AAD2|nr:hypothetical protein [Pseudomonas sp. FEN]